MRLKNRDHRPEGGFAFHYVRDSDGVAVRVDGANGMAQLTERVEKSFANNKMTVPPNLAEIIEHQICLRQSNPLDACWSGGIGDDLHHKWIKPFLSTAAAAMPGTGIMASVKKAVEKVAGCSSCGGTKIYDSKRDNTGRAGKLNRLARRMKTPKP